jgi:hypothetical protein
MSMDDARRRAIPPRRRRAPPSRADVEDAMRAFIHAAVSLSDLNGELRERGLSPVDEEGLRRMGFATRRHLGKVWDPSTRRYEASPAGKVRAIVVGASQEDVDASWHFADERRARRG